MISQVGTRPDPGGGARRRSARQIQRGRGPAGEPAQGRKTDSAWPRPPAGGARHRSARQIQRGRAPAGGRQAQKRKTDSARGTDWLPPYSIDRWRTFIPSVPRRAHSSPRHACALHRVLFLHCLQRGPAPALYGVLRASLAPARPAVPCAAGGVCVAPCGLLWPPSGGANFSGDHGNEVIR